jgi:hypothetical protein
VDISGAKLSRPSLLHRVGRYGDQHPDLRGPCSWGQFESWLRPNSFKGRGRQPLGEFIRTLVRLPVPVSASYHMRVPMQELRYAHNAPQGVTLPEDVVRWEANHVYSKRLWAQRQGRWDWSAARAAARAQGEETPSRLESSGGDDEEENEDGEEGEVTPPPHSSPLKDLPSLGDIFSRQVGISVGSQRLKQPWTETRSSTGPPPQP